MNPEVFVFIKRLFLKRWCSFQGKFIDWHVSLRCYKEKVVKGLTGVEESIARIVICTSAIGCGINCRSVVHVVHFGLSHDLVDYVHNIGRAERVGKDLCNAIWCYYPQRSPNITGQNQILCFKEVMFTKCNPFVTLVTDVVLLVPKFVVWSMPIICI